ncbi:MAG: substrate-binding domain-containing protein [Clostridiales bacterium]|jgi:phosphate transport system substrate-binding protein|nr:substrate-binding domain-containing protein [Clostridiales bacterium]
MNRLIGFIVIMMIAPFLTGCTGPETQRVENSPESPAQTIAEAAEVKETFEPPQNEATDNNFDTSREISIVSREDGSGTRGAFIELFGILEKGDGGSETDTTSEEAIIVNMTDVMMTNIANDDYAIGYVSLGSLNDSVKALDIDGVAATSENVKTGTYKVARPFNIATKGEVRGLAKDFIDFILSSEGQRIISGDYIAVNDAAPAYAGTRQSGKIVVAGSSSVTPIMEVLKEGYLLLNPEATIEIQMTDSSAGMAAVIDGVCDIGMASRELKESELTELTPIQIAIDGIAVIVNNNNVATGMASDEIKEIFTGAASTWGDIIN